MHFMMGLHEYFKPTRATQASLLSWSPTSFLDVIVKELISEENRRLTYHMSSSNHVFATPSPPSLPPIVAFTAPSWINFGCPTF